MIQALLQVILNIVENFEGEDEGWRESMGLTGFDYTKPNVIMKKKLWFVCVSFRASQLEQQTVLGAAYNTIPCFLPK